MEARLKAILEMDASELQKELVKSVNELKKFEREIAKTTDTQRIGELTSKITETKQKIEGLVVSMQKQGNAAMQAASGLNVVSDAGAKISSSFQEVEKKISTVSQVVSEKSKEISASLAFPKEAAHQSRVAMISDLDAIEKAFKEKTSQMAASSVAAGKVLSSLEKNVSAFGGGVAKFSTANVNFEKLSKTAPAAATAVQKTGTSFNLSGQNAQNFSRVIQDLPFGFMGIQNNLTQLIPGIGAAGIAFSVLTAAITFSQVGMSYWTKKTKDAKAAADEFLEVTREANKNAAQEVVNSRLLYQAATNTANAMDARLRAAKELQKEWPATFANYTAEEIALGKAEKGYRELTKAIIANARAVAAKNKITELEAQILDREDNVRKINAITAAQKKLAKTTTSGGTMGARVDISTDVSKREQIEARRLGAIKKEEAAMKALNAQIDFYAKFAGVDNLQKAATPPPAQAKATTQKAIATPAEKIGNYDQGNRKNWWRDSMNAQVGPDINTQLTDTTKVKLGENATLNKILAEQSSIYEGLNKQMEQANGLAEYGGAVFGQMAMAMMQGTNIGDVLATTIKNLVSQLIQAVAQAAIFAAIMSAISPGMGSFGSLFSSQLGGPGGGFGNLLGMISGQNIELSNSRTSTGMGYRRGRR